jgi:ferritin-like metal-binding protein YciE
MPKKRKPTINKKKQPKEATLHELLLQKLSVLADVENELVKALPKLAKASTDEKLEEGFRMHLDETKNHSKRLEEAFKLLDSKPQRSLRSSGIRGIIEDGQWVIKNIKPDEALDANLIAAASYAEHYEMAGYKAAIEWAETMGHTKVADLLRANLEEEEAADKKLAELAQADINSKANTLSEEMVIE